MMCIKTYAAGSRGIDPLESAACIAKRDHLLTRNYLISIYGTMPSAAYTDLTHLTVWLNQISRSQIKEHETRFGWIVFERCSRSYQAVVLHSRLMGITARTNLGFPAKETCKFLCVCTFLRTQRESHWNQLEFISMQQIKD